MIIKLSNELSRNNKFSDLEKGKKVQTMSYLYRADECLVGKRPKWRAKISIDVEAAAFSRILRTVFNFLFKKIVTRIVLVDDFWTFSRSRKFTHVSKRMAKYHFSNLICHFFRLPLKMSHNSKRIVCISLSRLVHSMKFFEKQISSNFSFRLFMASNFFSSQNCSLRSEK